LAGWIDACKLRCGDGAPPRDVKSGRVMPKDQSRACSCGGDCDADFSAMSTSCLSGLIGDGGADSEMLDVPLFPAGAVGSSFAAAPGSRFQSPAGGASDPPGTSPPPDDTPGLPFPTLPSPMLPFDPPSGSKPSTGSKPLCGVLPGWGGTPGKGGKPGSGTETPTESEPL
jgi:hypothetical protein